MSDLKAQAEELGIKVDGRWSGERLQQEIDKVLGAGPLDHDKDGKKGGAVKVVPVFLDFDTWIGTDRIRADSDNPQMLPLPLVKQLLAEGKARRADPLPGE